MPDEKSAVTWLQEASLGTLVEAVGGSYTGYARISTHSGQPALLGWPGHEVQWRGGGAEMGSRQEDIRLLYETNDWEQAEDIIRRYGIDYIFVGQLESTTYRVIADKFIQNLIPVFQQGEVAVFGTP